MTSSLVDITIGVDPGLGGGIGILLGDSAVVYDVPIYKFKVKKRTKKMGLHEVNKKDYDLKGMWNIIKKFQGTSNVLFAIEQVGIRPHDAKGSMFNFGQGVGFWKGMAIAAGFDIVEVAPQTWKKHYPEMLNTKDIINIRDSIKALRAKTKLIKDKKQKSSIKKEIDSLNRSLKSNAKDESRRLAATLFPDIEDEFKLKKDDGKAEAILICKWCKETQQK